MRDVSDRNILDDFCVKFCSVVETHCKYIIVSGFVAISSGRTRATEDIDMIVERLPLEKFKAMRADLIKKGFICMQSESPEEIFSYLKNKTAVRYTLKNSPLPEMELKFAKDPLDDVQIAQRVKLPLTGIDVWFGSIATNIAYKEEYLKSEKDLKDAEHLRKVFDVDEREISEMKKMIRKFR